MLLRNNIESKIRFRRFRHKLNQSILEVKHEEHNLFECVRMTPVRKQYINRKVYKQFLEFFI